jgi:glycosyltransferase involved in cell wall biosynthesis
VWQRPQQFISRLTRNRKALFVETIGPDPELAAPLAKFRSAGPRAPNVTLLRLQFPSWQWQDGDLVDAGRRRLVRDFMEHGPLAGQWRQPIQWFYDPMAVTAFAGQMDEVLTVYDCMDELSKFAYAPPHIAEREAELLARADLVFTGGRRLYEAKSRAHANCHFYGCGVDTDHFGQARQPDTAVPEALAALPAPRLGYFGVIDERMDLELVAALADANPAWSVVMIGPVLKIDGGNLPRRPNLHWLGRQEYADLPRFCKGLDVCLMPFALNAATEFINPTKALEYMATGRPIVSTAVPDVVSNFGTVVQIARSPDAFIELCRRAAADPDREILERGLRFAAENTWDFIVSRLEHHLSASLAKTHSNDFA